jgi:hypothetical protein
LNACGRVLDRRTATRDGNEAFIALSRRAYAGGNFQWSGVKSPEKATLDLTLAHVRTVLNDQASLPKQVGLAAGVASIQKIPVKFSGLQRSAIYRQSFAFTGGNKEFLGSVIKIRRRERSL